MQRCGCILVSLNDTCFNHCLLCFNSRECNLWFNSFIWIRPSPFTVWWHWVTATYHLKTNRERERCCAFLGIVSSSICRDPSPKHNNTGFLCAWEFERWQLMCSRSLCLESCASGKSYCQSRPKYNLCYINKCSRSRVKLSGSYGQNWKAKHAVN